MRSLRRDQKGENLERFAIAALSATINALCTTELLTSSSTPRYSFLSFFSSNRAGVARSQGSPAFGRKEEAREKDANETRTCVKRVRFAAKLGGGGWNGDLAAGSTRETKSELPSSS